MEVLMPLITARSSKGMLVNWVPVLSVLPDEFARFLFEFHSVRFESLDLPILPDDRSQYDVHCALEDDKVKKSEYTVNAYDVHDNCYDDINYINYSYYVD